MVRMDPNGYILYRLNEGVIMRRCQGFHLS